MLPIVLASVFGLGLALATPASAADGGPRFAISFDLHGERPIVRVGHVRHTSPRVSHRHGYERDLVHAYRPSRRARRLFRKAERAFWLGRYERAERLIHRAVHAERRHVDRHHWRGRHTRHGHDDRRRGRHHRRH